MSKKFISGWPGVSTGKEVWAGIFCYGFIATEAGQFFHTRGPGNAAGFKPWANWLLRPGH
jgi:hypothetical protein